MTRQPNCLYGHPDRIEISIREVERKQTRNLDLLRVIKVELETNHVLIATIEETVTSLEHLSAKWVQRRPHA